jgi:hypothetical protein
MRTSRNEEEEEEEEEKKKTRAALHKCSMLRIALKKRKLSPDYINAVLRTALKKTSQMKVYMFLCI